MAVANHTIFVDIDESTTPDHFTNPATHLKIKNGRGAHARCEHLHRGETVLWRSTTGGLKIKFTNKSPFVADPSEISSAGSTTLATVSSTADLSTPFKYTVTVTDSNRRPFPEDPQVMIDPGKNLSITKWIVPVLGLAIGAALWTFRSLWTDADDSR